MVPIWKELVNYKPVPVNMPKNPESGLLVKLSSNDRRLKPFLNRKGYEFVTKVDMGRRTADWPVYKYTGTTASESAPAAQALP
jgi:hypothetical protein